MYAQVFMEFLKREGIKTFTHKDIQKATTANCTYSVVRSLKRLIEKQGRALVWILDKNTNQNGETKSFRRYFIEEN